MSVRIVLVASAALTASLVSGIANAALQGRDLDGNAASAEAYYDTVLNITWLTDANEAAADEFLPGSIYANSFGEMSWWNALAWAADLSFHDGINNITYANWRLPSADADEFGYMYDTYLSTGNSIFFSLQNGSYYNGYWTSTPISYGLNPHAVYFNMFNGLYYGNYQAANYFAIAVSDGDIGVAVVPEAQTYALMLAGLGLVGWRARRRG